MNEDPLLPPDERLSPAWLASPLGHALLVSETEVLRHVLDGVFGEHLLQLGRWGDGAGVSALARTQVVTRVYGPGEGGDISAAFAALPFATGSVDAIVMPHTLDYAASPHDVLREAHRVLRAEGKLVLLGFKPFGFWGLRRVLGGGGFPPGVHHAVGERSLRDWCALLNMRVDDYQRFFFRLPLQRRGAPISGSWEQFGRRWWPELAACHLVCARKRVASVTPVRPSWRQRARVVGGVPEPSLRQVSRVRDRTTDGDVSPG